MAAAASSRCSGGHRPLAIALRFLGSVAFKAASLPLLLVLLVGSC